MWILSTFGLDKYFNHWLAVAMWSFLELQEINNHNSLKADLMWSTERLSLSPWAATLREEGLCIVVKMVLLCSTSVTLGKFSTLPFNKGKYSIRRMQTGESIKPLPWVLYPYGADESIQFLFPWEHTTLRQSLPWTLGQTREQSILVRPLPRGWSVTGHWHLTLPTFLGISACYFCLTLQQKGHQRSSPWSTQNQSGPGLNECRTHERL